MRALAISLLAHAWLLAVGWPQLPTLAGGSVLQATLRPAAAQRAGSAAAPQPSPPAPQASRAVRKAPPGLAAERPAAPVQGARADPVMAASAGVAVAALPAMVQGTAGGPPPAAPREPAAGASGAGAVAGDGVDAEGLRQYRLALAREARRYKRYPERALLAGIGGTAEVRVEHAAGSAPVVRLVRSSGDETLDAAAVGMMREAAPRAPMPETLRGQSFAVNLPVIFDANAE